MSGKIRLNREEQVFLMEMLETDSPMEAVEKFASLMIEEKVDPTHLEKYLKLIIKGMK